MLPLIFTIVGCILGSVVYGRILRIVWSHLEWPLAMIGLYEKEEGWSSDGGSSRRTKMEQWPPR